MMQNANKTGIFYISVPRCEKHPGFGMQMAKAA